jgi:DNA-binding XRE family transcriptional regulator
MVVDFVNAAVSPGPLRRDLDLSRERMARLVDVSAKTIERWEEQKSLPSDNRVRIQLAQIQQVRDLGLTVYTLDGFRLFMRTPLPTVGGRTPLQLIEQGQIDDVIAALASDYEGLGF